MMLSMSSMYSLYCGEHFEEAYLNAHCVFWMMSFKSLNLSIFSFLECYLFDSNAYAFL